MGRLFLIDLEDEEIYSCKFCRTQLALVDGITCEDYEINGGIAYLFWEVVNVSEVEVEHLERRSFAPIDIFCVRCGSIVGNKSRSNLSKFLKGDCALERSRVVA